MKKMLLSLLMISCFPASAVSVEGDASVFFPTDNVMQKVYGTLWQNYGIMVSHLQPLWGGAQPLSFFGQVNYIFSRGYSEGGDERTRIQLVPLTFGLQWIQPVTDGIELFVGAAPRYYFMKIENDSPYVPCTVKDKGCGFYCSFGSFIVPREHFMITLFVDYSYMKFKAPAAQTGLVSFATPVSGFSLGGGLGWNF